MRWSARIPRRGASNGHRRMPVGGPCRPVLAFAMASSLAGCGATTSATASPASTASHADERSSRSTDDAKTESPPARADDADHAPGAQERAVIDKLARQAERLRKLSFAREVPVAIHDRDRIAKALTDQIEKGDLAEARSLYGALGLIEPDVDMWDVMSRLVAEQVVGYYDPKADRLVVRRNIMRAMGSVPGEGTQDVDQARLVLFHELVHALQDQRLDLGKRYEVERDTDGENAFRALVEGDATLAMLGYTTARVLRAAAGQPASGGKSPLRPTDHAMALVSSNPEQLHKRVKRTESLPGMELGSAPAIIRVSLVAPYLHGMVFAAELYRRSGWTAVNNAHESPPVSTEQVIHPEAYLRGERPDSVELPELPALEDAGLKPITEDTLGELEMGVYFAQGTEADADEEAAAGWSGDRLRVYRTPDPDTSNVVVWFMSWDDPGEAEEAKAEAVRICRSLDKVARKRCRVERRDRALLAIRGLAPDLHHPVRNAFEEFADALPAGPPVSGGPP